jgi:flagellar motor protein MotB
LGERYWRDSEVLLDCTLAARRTRMEIDEELLRMFVKAAVTQPPAAAASAAAAAVAAAEAAVAAAEAAEAAEAARTAERTCGDFMRSQEKIKEQAPALARAARAGQQQQQQQEEKQQHDQEQQQQQQLEEQKLQDYEQQQQQRLRLHSFSSSNMLKVVDLLAVLHPHSLTHLSLGLFEAMTTSSALSAAFMQLNSLRQLHLHDVFVVSHGSALTALAHLSQLTMLQLSGDWPTVHLKLEDVRYSRPREPQPLEPPVAAALQQLLAQPLPLQNLELRLGCKLPVLDMSNLTQLKQLSIGHSLVDDDSLLPATLQQLDFHAWSSAHSLAPVTRLQLQQLQHLTLCVDFDQPQQLLQLAQLPALQHLSLRYVHRHSTKPGQAAVATASAWPLLPQLQELIVRVVLPYRHEMAHILDGIAAATSLTELELKVDFEDEVDISMPGIAVCSRLSCLTRLKDLSCYLTMRTPDPQCRIRFHKCTMELAPVDACKLTALTNLTRLELLHAGRGVGTLAAGLLARDLKRLQHLCLRGCNIELCSVAGIVCLAMIGGLTQLTHLELDSSTTAQGWVQLARLARRVCVA